MSIFPDESTGMFDHTVVDSTTTSQVQGDATDFLPSEHSDHHSHMSNSATLPIHHTI